MRDFDDLQDGRGDGRLLQWTSYELLRQSAPATRTFPLTEWKSVRDGNLASARIDRDFDYRDYVAVPGGPSAASGMSRTLGSRNVGWPT